jgi:hypothetical protein
VNHPHKTDATNTNVHIRFSWKSLFNRDLDTLTTIHFIVMVSQFQGKSMFFLQNWKTSLDTRQQLLYHASNSSPERQRRVLSAG